MSSLPPDHRDEDLLHIARGGDRVAFDALVQRSQQKIARLVRARMGAELRRVEESDDLVQTALVAAMRDLPSFEDRGEGSFLRWLSTVVENKIRHHLRDQRRDCRNPDRAQSLPSGFSHGLAAKDPSPSAQAQSIEIEQRYHQALERLEVTERELLLLHLELGWTHAEIAQAIGIVSAEAARKRVARAVARLGSLMGGPPK